MANEIIDSFQLGADIPLDDRYVVNTYYDVSEYWYPGMQVFQLSDEQIWFFDGSIWSPMKEMEPFDIDVINGGENWKNPTQNVIVGGIAWVNSGD